MAVTWKERIVVRGISAQSGSSKVCVTCGVEKPCTSAYFEGNRSKCRECRNIEQKIRKEKQKKGDIVLFKCHEMASSAYARVFAPSREYKKSYRNISEPFGFESIAGMSSFLYEHFYDDIVCLMKANKIPSVDRIDSTKGYSPENIRVLDFKTNTLLGVEKRKRPIKVTYPDGGYKVFESAEACAKEFKTNSGHIRGWIQGKYKPKNKCFFNYVS